MASALPGCANYRNDGTRQPSDFSFVQLSDVHWGYANPKVNPEPRQALLRAVAAVNALEQQPDFVVFTGDLTQTTDDPQAASRAAARGAGDRCRAASAAGAVLRRRARRIAGSRRGLSGGVRWCAELHLRSQGRSLHRPRQHLAAGAGAGRGATRLAPQGPRRPGEGGADRRPDASAAVSRSTRNGTGRRGTGRRRSTCCPRMRMSPSSTATFTTSTTT